MKELKNHKKKILFLAAFVLCCSFVFAQPSANFTADAVSGCAPLTVNFQDISPGNPTSWQWDLGNGSTSSQQTPTTTYFNAGTYTVLLTVSNAAGTDSIKKVSYITVYDKPTVDFSSPTTSGCFPLTVNFTDLSTAGSGSNIDWNWDFGDGDTSTLQNPSHKYSASGNYSITLKVTNSNGCQKVSSKIQYIKVTTGVTAQFNNSYPIHCKPPELITFNNLSTGPGTLTYQWIFGDGNTSTLKSPSNNYLTGGTYPVQLIVKSNMGCADTLLRPDSVSIRDFQTIFSGPDSICNGITASFSNISIPVDTISLWSFGDGTSSTLNNPTKTWNTNGTYQVKLINDYGVCIDSFVKPVKVVSPPIVDFKATDTFNCKAPFTTQFMDLSSGSISWFWNFGDGNTSTAQNPTHTYTAPGYYTVTLTTQNASGCSGFAFKTQYIHITNPTLSVAGLPGGGCLPFTFSPITTINDPKGIATYAWDFGDGNTSNAANPTNNYNTLGTFTVKLYVTTNDGCNDTLISVNGIKTGTPPTVDFSASPLVQCVGQDVQFTDMSIAPVDSWQWDFGDGGSSTSQNPTYAYQKNGTYDVKLTATNNGCATTIKKTKYIQALPPVSKFTPVFNCVNRLNISFTDNSVLPQTWSWDFGDGNTSTAQNPTYTYGSLGTYNVKLTVTNAGCSNTKSIPVTLIDENPDFTTQKDSICRNTGLFITTTNVNKANISSYNYIYGDGFTVSGPSYNPPPHIYTNPGTYSVQVITTDLHGCKDTASKPNLIYVHGPTAKFTAAPLAGCKGLNVTFTDASFSDGIIPIKNWQWTYGDGVIQTLTAPPFTHTYNTTGNFKPQLRVTDTSGCFDSLILNTPILVTMPKASFNTADTVACNGGNVIFTNTSSGVTPTYQWTLGNGVSSTQTNPVTSYNIDSIYSIKLVVTDVNGCKDSLQKNNYLRVETEKAGFTITDSISSCSPFEVDFTNTSINSTSQTWNFGDGSSSTSKNPVHYYSTPGTYFATLYATGKGGCVDSFKHTIQLYSSAATLTYVPVAGCSNTTVNFHISTAGPVQYLWDFGDGNILSSTDSSVSNDYVQAGNFIPKVIMTDPSGCKIPITGIDTIRLTKSNVDFAASDSTVCIGTPIIFYDSTTTNAPIASYHWNFGDGAVSLQQKPTHAYSSAGTYSISLLVSTVNGCSDSLIKTGLIHVYGPTANFNTSTLNACRNITSIIFTDNSLTDGIHSIANWQWNYGDGITQNLNGPPFSHTYDSAGTFTPQLKITDTYGCSDSFTLNTPIQVALVKAAFSSADTAVCIGTNVTFINNSIGNNLTYAWTLGNGNNSVQVSPVTSYSADGSYSVKLVATDNNGCTDSLIRNNYIHVQTVKAGFTVSDSVTLCPPLNVQFTNTSVNYTSLAWDFGDGNTSNAINPTHSYSGAGIYTATLIATGPGGCVDSFKHSIQIFSSAATLTYVPLSGCMQVTVNFHIAATGPVGYDWDFKDGDTAITILPDVVHTYTIPGIYIPQVIMKDAGGCKVTVSGPDTIHIYKLTAAFNVADSDICLGNTINFNDRSTSNSTITSWHWDFGDGNTSTAQNPAHTYATQGTYSVQLIINTVDGCSDSIVKNNFIHIYGLKAKFGASILNGCGPLAVNFTDSSLTDGIHPVSNWQWNYGDGITENLNSPPFSHTYDSAGNFIPQLKLTDAFGCSDSFMLNNTISVFRPIAGFISSDTLACIGTNVAFTNNSTGSNLTYAWAFGNGVNSIQPSPVISYTTDGNYSVKLVVTDNNGCADSVTKNNYIHVQTVKAGFTISDSVTLCPPLNVQFTNTSVNDTSFFWNFGDGSTSTSANPSHSYTTSGTYIATLIATGTGGCVDSFKRTIQVLSSATVFTYVPLTGCSQMTVNFHALTAGPVTYFFDFNDGDTLTSPLTDVTHTYTKAGNYIPTLIVKDQSGCQIPVIGIDTIHLTGTKANFNVADSNICFGNTINFTDQSITNSTIASWHWDFGDGNTSSQQNPSYQYKNNGAYTTQLAITTIDGCTDTITKNNFIHIYGPTAKFGTSVFSGCASLNIPFSDSSSSDGIHLVTNWQWNYGDGITQNLNGPPFSHTYDSAGTFTPQLKITDTYGCSDSFTLNTPIQVALVKAAFSSADTAVCIGTNVTFINNSIGNNLTYAWTLGNGNNSVQVSPVTSYSADGSYSVKLVATDNNGCTDSLIRNNYIHVQTVKAGFTVSDSVTLCPPLNVQFTNTSVNYTSLAWDFGDGNTSNAINPTHSYSGAGIYTATLIATGPGGCVDSFKHSIQIFSSAATLTYVPLSGCMQVTVNFHIAATGPVGYDWDFKDGDTAITILPDVVHTYTIPGIYIPQVIMKDAGGCKVTVSGPDTIHIYKLTAAFNVADSDICLGNTINFNDRSTSNSTITSWHWDFGDGNTSTAQNPAHTYATQGTYSVQLIINTVDGCSDSIVKNNFITIHTTPKIDIDGNTTSCAPANLLFTGIIVVPDTATIAWKWNFGNGNTSNSQNPVAQKYNAAGSFPLQLIATTFSGCADTVNKTIVIHPLPTTDAGQNTNICLNQSTALQATGADSYTWSPSTNLSCNSCSNPVATPTDDIVYYVKGATIYGCETMDSVSIKVKKPLSITVTPTADSICVGKSVQLNASGSDIYSWTPASGLNSVSSPNPVAAPSSTTTYKVVAHDNMNCFTDSASVKITVFPYPTVEAGKDQKIPFGQSVTLAPLYSSDVSNWLWNPSTGLSCYTCPNPVALPQVSTTYTITVTNKGGCSAKDSFTILLPCQSSVFIPNTFSPNNDGANDVFYPRGKDVYLIQSLRIFDRWGEVVFERTNFSPNDPLQGWDGHFGGRAASADVYTYIIEIICNNGEISAFKGNVTLIR